MKTAKNVQDQLDDLDEVEITLVELANKLDTKAAHEMCDSARRATRRIREYLLSAGASEHSSLHMALYNITGLFITGPLQKERKNHPQVRAAVARSHVSRNAWSRSRETRGRKPMTATYADWDLGVGLDQQSRIGRTIKSLADQWNGAKVAVTNLRTSLARRYEVYELHSTEASKISTLRQQRALEFMEAWTEIGQRMKMARSHVREEIAAERQTITAAFRAEANQLRFWNVIKHAKARIRYARRLAGHKMKPAVHPVALRTLRRKAICRSALRIEAVHYLASDNILRQAQRAHSREAWIGPLRPSVRASGPAAAPA